MHQASTSGRQLWPAPANQTLADKPLSTTHAACAVHHCTLKAWLPGCRLPAPTPSAAGTTGPAGVRRRPLGPGSWAPPGPPGRLHHRSRALPGRQWWHCPCRAGSQWQWDPSSPPGGCWAAQGRTCTAPGRAGQRVSVPGAGGAAIMSSRARPPLVPCSAQPLPPAGPHLQRRCRVHRERICSRGGGGNGHLHVLCEVEQRHLAIARHHGGRRRVALQRSRGQGCASGLALPASRLALRPCPPPTLWRQSTTSLTPLTGQCLARPPPRCLRAAHPAWVPARAGCQLLVGGWAHLALHHGGEERIPSCGRGHKQGAAGGSQGSSSQGSGSEGTREPVATCQAGSPAHGAPLLIVKRAVGASHCPHCTSSSPQAPTGPPAGPVSVPAPATVGALGLCGGVREAGAQRRRPQAAAILRCPRGPACCCRAPA